MASTTTAKQVTSSSSANGGATSATLAPSLSSTATTSNGDPAFRATTLRTGDVVVLGMRVDASINCAGMARFRLFQGHVEVLGFQPALGTYYSLYSPKWSSLLVIEGRTNADTRSEATKALLDAAYQAPFSNASRELLALELGAPTHIEIDDEHAADALARDMAEDFPIVLVLRAIPVTHGTLMCYYESASRSFEPSADAVLPGFKMLVARDAVMPSSTTMMTSLSLPTANPLSHYHDWKSPARVLAELVVPETFRTVQITAAWRHAADSVESSLLADRNRPQRIVVCGAKGVGKSTFCRYLVHRLLAHFGTIAFLDTDLGQSELTPPGLVSLHALTAPVLGPGFTHMHQPLRSFFCGGTNPGTDPLLYMRAVQSLLRLYDRKWGCVGPSADTATEPATGTDIGIATGKSTNTACVPLIVNTDGWIKSMGHDLLCSVIEHAVPDHVVQLLATTKSKQFAVPTTGAWTVHGVAPWDASGTAQPPRSSKDMRLYRWHQYFLSHSRVTAVPRPQLQNFHVLADKRRVDDLVARAYAHAVPVAVPFASVDVAFAGCSVAPSQLLVSLNNSIVGLCVNPQRPPVIASSNILATDTDSDANHLNDDNDHAIQSPAVPRILLATAHAPCLGVGLVRAVDVERRLLFVLSPLPLALLQRVNLLVRGNFPLASLIVDVDEPVQAPYAVADVLPSEGTGAAAMQSRNNIKRKRDDKTSK